MDTEVLKRGVKTATPVMTSYVAIGLACGMVLFDAGFHLFEILLVSLFVYSGSGQFLLASMVLLGSSIPSIILTTLFLNVRSILMSASIAEYIKEESKLYLVLFGLTLTDESFGLNYAYFQQDSWTSKDALVINTANYASWVLSTVAGGALGSVIQIDTKIMSFAIVALFVSMMATQFISKSYVIAAAAAVILTVLINSVLNHNISIVMAALIASFIGYLIDIHSPSDSKGGKVA